VRTTAARTIIYLRRFSRRSIDSAKINQSVSVNLRHRTSRREIIHSRTNRTRLEN